MHINPSTGRPVIRPTPDVPWPVGVLTNSRRTGWFAFFDGVHRHQCPYPRDRSDLALAYEEGWDEAEKKHYSARPMTEHHSGDIAGGDARVYFDPIEPELKSETLGSSAHFGAEITPVRYTPVYYAPVEHRVCYSYPEAEKLGLTEGWQICAVQPGGQCTSPIFYLKRQGV